jgi:uncharacterized protein with PQ loop repeat
MLFLTFFPAQSVEHDLAASTPSLTALDPVKPTSPRRRDAVLVGSMILLALFTVGLTSLAMLAVYPHHTLGWANFLGSVAGTLAAIQYIPQIYFTFRRKDVGSLSIVTMIIQVPGAFLFAFSLWLRVGWGGWSTWLVYLVTGVLQAILFGLAVKYYFEAKATSSVEDHEEDMQPDSENEQVDERTALLNGSQRSKRRPIQDTPAGARQSSGRTLDMLYAATPPENDSDRSQ